MRSLLQLIDDNRPSNKPEMWRDPGRVLRRKLTFWINRRIDRSWGQRPYISTLRDDGLLLEVLPSDVVGRPIAEFGVYEYAVTELLRGYLHPGDCFVDVGANIGYYSVLAAAIVSRTGKVIAFEPSDRVRKRLVRNVELNELNQVEIRGDAVGERAGVVRLVEPQDTGNDGLAYVTVDTTIGRDVACVTLDSLIEVGNVPTLIKVDVEGGEQRVFAGAARLFARDDAPSLIFESFDVGNDSVQLRAHGYRLFQPVLRNGRIALTEDLGLPRYRRWEAPNFLAAKSQRGLTFATSLLD